MKIRAGFCQKNLCVKVWLGGARGFLNPIPVYPVHPAYPAYPVKKLNHLLDSVIF